MNELCKRCSAGDWKAVSALLNPLAEAAVAAGSEDPDADVAAQVLNRVGSKGRTPLHCASRAGSSLIVTELLLRGADPTLR